MPFNEDLTEALQKAVAFYNEGHDANEAVVKSAQAMGFNMDQTDRLVEKFNTAKTINYFDRHQEDRTRDFDIASKEKVAELIYGDKSEKEASAGASDGYHDYTCYDSKESDYFKSMEKQAESVTDRYEKENNDPAKGYSLDGLFRMAIKMANDEGELAKFIREKTSMMNDVITTELSKIASALVSGYEPEEKYASFKAACKDNPLFGLLDGLVPAYVKKAAAPYEKRLARSNIIDLGELQGFADNLSSLAKYAEEISKFEKKAEEYEAEKKRIMSDLRKSAAITAPTATRGGGGPGGGGHSGGSNGGAGGGNSGGGKKGGGDGKSKEYNAAADFLRLGSNTIGKAIPRGIEEYMQLGPLGLTLDDVRQAMNKRPKPDMSIKQHIDNLRRSDILNDLYENDPILSEADPRDLARAYSTLVESTPEVSMNKEVVRAILRQSVNSVATSPFDVKQWADLENVLLKNRGRIGGSKL